MVVLVYMEHHTTVSTDIEQVEELLTRGVAQVIPYEETKAKLLSGKQLRIKLGTDPTSPNLHLGRSIPLLKLRDFQKLGHHVVLIIGDFTALIGDTSDKDSGRPMLTREQVQENLVRYKEQAGKILDMEQVEFHYNSEWLGKLDYNEIGEHCDCFSINDFISRELIAKRLQEGKRVSLREVLYPVMQGYDSVAIKSDIELGGTDQTFNVLAGRTLQEHFGQEKQSVITFNLIDGTDGRKASSSWGNTINFLDSHTEMYGKLMSLHDRLIITYFESITRVSMQEISEIKNKLEAGENPMEFKKLLARTVVEMYHSKELAQQAEANWIETFSNKGLPTDIPEFSLVAGESLIDLLVRTSCSDSKTKARLLIEEGAVKNAETEEKFSSESFAELLDENKKQLVLKVGKKRFIKLV